MPFIHVFWPSFSSVAIKLSPNAYILLLEKILYFLIVVMAHKMAINTLNFINFSFCRPLTVFEFLWPFLWAKSAIWNYTLFLQELVHGFPICWHAPVTIGTHLNTTWWLQAAELKDSKNINKGNFKYWWPFFGGQIYYMEIRYFLQALVYGFSWVAMIL